MSLGLSGRKRHIKESQTKTSNYQRDKRELFTNIDSASFRSSPLSSRSAYSRLVESLQ
jgi:hypothetical protein